VDLDFWQETGIPLSFQVKNDNLAAKNAFLATYKGDTKQHPNALWTVGWAAKATLEGQSAVEEVWKHLEPLLNSIRFADRGSWVLPE
jgi:hypothetical protein